MTPHVCRLLSAIALAVPAAAQSFLDLTEVRNPANPYFSVFEIEAGAIGVQPTDEDEGSGLESGISWDGHVYWRDDSFSARRGTLEAYAGRDGLYGGFYDGKIVGDDTVTRLEVRARPWQFYRDGFYRGGAFVPNGLYEGRDYEGYLGFGRDAQGLYIELGPYYRQNDFARGDRTPNSFTIPEDYAAYGGRLYLEQSSVQMDRRRGMPRDGFVLTLLGEREWNDSQGEIGTAGFLTELPSAVWRMRGRLEWYVPSSDDMTWEIFARGGYCDEKDRVVNYDSTHPLGNLWGDAQLRLRIHLGSSWTVTPFAHGQYSRLLDEFGRSADKKFFVGGGVESYLHLSEAFSLHGFYSFLDNESRPSIRVDEDVHGEHMFYLGLVMRFGGQRR
ncbi:MAG: hypothetical protein FJ265_17090 [Planctomycetes bacterium]|nr:hypothetical protein [Planctomycetota bacterium]